MRILLIEDEIASAEGIVEDISGLSHDIECEVATCRDTAIALVDGEEFDLLVCDLLLPTEPSGLDQSIQHGLAVYEHARAVAPGTPAIFLTGHADFRDVRRQLPSRAPEDLFGTGTNVQMVDLIYKDEREKYLEYIEAIAQGLEGLDREVRIEVRSARNPLTEMEERLLRIYGRTTSAGNIVAEELGGLSGMRSLRLHMLDSAGAHLAWTFGKLGAAVKIDEEKRRIQTISPRLRVGTYASLVGVVQAGAGKLSGLFYNLADDYPYSALDWIRADLSRMRSFVARIRAITDDWQESKTSKDTLVGDLRRVQIADEILAPFSSALQTSPWRQIEERSIEVTETLQHGDLHGFNILVRADGQPLLIDFGRTGSSSCCLDPIVLELSVFFHEQSPFKDEPWPALEQCENWPDLDAFVAGALLEDFIRDVRSWTLEVAPSEELVYATAYCHSLRQLKYPDTDKARALAIARGSARRLAVLLGADGEP